MSANRWEDDADARSGPALWLVLAIGGVAIGAPLACLFALLL